MKRGLMMRSIPSLLMISVLLLFSAGVFAGEFYQYVNEEGVVIYTDDASKIPVDQRESAGRIRSIESKNIPTPDISGGQTTAAGEESQGKKGAEADTEALDAELEGLKKLQSDLDVEYEKINAELQRLNSVSQTVKGRKNIRAHNVQVEALNQRSREYQVKQKMYAEKVEAYNKKVAASSKE